MKKCIWCCRTEETATFNTKAHTIPQSMGGKFICENVCDKCNDFFGEHSNGLPSIETVLKEAFLPSKVMLIHHQGEIGKNKLIPRINSHYFDINVKKWKIKPKMAYKVRPGFQRLLGRQLRKGIFKVFLEETERVNKDGLDSKFDFIREFVRLDLGDYPVFYFQWHFAVHVPTDLMNFREPQIYFEEDWRAKWLMAGFGFFEFELMCHTFSVPIIRDYKLMMDWYKQETIKIKKVAFSEMREIEYFTDMDITLRFLNDKK